MKIERTFVGNESFLKVFWPLVEAEIDRIMEQLSDFQYNEGNFRLWGYLKKFD